MASRAPHDAQPEAFKDVHQSLTGRGREMAMRKSALFSAKANRPGNADIA